MSNLVCFQRADSDHTDVVLAWQAGEGEPPLLASAGSVVASLAAPPATRPLGPSMADGSGGPQMQVVLENPGM